ncbi:MAG: translational activator for mitochondrial COX1 [Sporothrix epigloea]
MASSETALRAMLSSLCRQCRRTPARPRALASVHTHARRLSITAGRFRSTLATAPVASTAKATSASQASDVRPRWKADGRRSGISSGAPTNPAISSIEAQKRRNSTSVLAAKTDNARLTAAQISEAEKKTRVLYDDNLFHSFTDSPIADMRKRAAYIKMHAHCPHPHHQSTRLPAAEPRLKTTLARFEDSALPPAHVDFECPDCGVPVYCCEEHWMDDYEAHLEICGTLQQINEDDHDLRSGRVFPEFDYPGPQMEEALVNMTNWDTLMYTRGFNAISDDRSMRQVTRLLTYPLTIASVLHELSPYSIRKGGQLTTEGLKSFSALRYTLHPPKSGESDSIKGLRPQAPAVRLFILGARAESSLPRDVWVQLAHLFPSARIHLIFIGPESMTNRDDEFPLPPRTAENPFGAVVEDRVWSTMKMSTIVDYYHTIHKTGHFYPYDPYFDCFVMFHPGLGHPASSHEWAETVPFLLETKAPIIVTGYTQYDMERDIEWVNKTARGEFDLLMEPGENLFRSLRWDLNDMDPQDISCGNWGLWAFRGKRYEATRQETEQ